MEKNIPSFLSAEKLLISLQKNKPQVLLVSVGLIFLIAGFLFFKNFNFGGDKVEVLGEQVASPSGEIVVEISGAVQKEGVFSLPFGSRVNDLLVFANGLSSDADRSWVDKNINKAAKLVDGQKIYIPFNKTNNGSSSEYSPNLSEGSGLVNVNTASLSELDSLPGIGPIYASNIVEHRPYSTVEELVTKGAIKQSLLDKIKDKISVF